MRIGEQAFEPAFNEFMRIANWNGFHGEWVGRLQTRSRSLHSPA
jgi:hypothetical protein